MVLGDVIGQSTSATGTPTQTVYQMRTYTVAPGKMPTLLKRFREHTMRLLERHGMTNVGYWTPEGEESDGKLIYLLAHESKQAAENSWPAFKNDPEWKSIFAETEANGRLVNNIESVFLTPTDFSNLPGLKQVRNKAVATAFVDEFFNKKNLAAAEQFLTEEYTQHNPGVPTGRKALLEFASEFLKGNPQLSLEIKRVAAEGDYVYLHGHLKLNPTDGGSAVVDIYRLEDGKIAEHWDVIQPIPDTAANNNTMF